MLVHCHSSVLENKVKASGPWLWIFHITLAFLGLSKCCTEGEVILGSQYGTHSKRNQLHMRAATFICMSWQICKTSLDIYPLQWPHSCTTHSSTLTCYINTISTKTELHSLQNYVEKLPFTRLLWIIHYRHMTGRVQSPLFILAGDTAQVKGQGSLSRLMSRSDNGQLWGWGLIQHFFVIRRCSNFMHSQQSSNELTMDS